MSNKGIDVAWIHKLKHKVPQFLEKLKSYQKPGFYHYSLSGDLYGEDVNWGLGNTVFAIKIYYMLNLLKELPEKDLEDMVAFIRSFQKSDGSIYDPLIKKQTIHNALSERIMFFRRILSAIKKLDFSNVIGQQTIRAETKQAIASLSLLDKKPDIPYKNFPKTKRGIELYLKKLNWALPWGAGSHFNHLIFFLKNYCNDMDYAENLMDYTINWVNQLQSPENGSWYYGNNVSLSQKINGAMKIIRGLNAANRLNFKYPEKLIDLCLSVVDFKGACDILNVLYVLRYANELTENKYRYKDIEIFCHNWLRIAKKHYFPNIGGFSFHLGRANDVYYGVRITKGLNEPDIHGTVMLLWGISLISKIFKLDLGLKEPIT